MALNDNALLTVPELRAQLKITGTDQDTTLEALINGSSDYLETLSGRRLAQRTYTDDVVRILPEWVWGADWYDVEYPIVTLEALAIDGVAQTIFTVGGGAIPTGADVYILPARDPKHGPDRLSRPSGWPLGALVTRTYTAGYDPIPGDLKQAALTLAVDWYYRRDRQSDPVISRSAGAETITYVNESLPRTLPTLLNGYRRWR